MQRVNMKIVDVEIAAFEPRFSGNGYVSFYALQQVLFSQLVRITLSDGSRGVGESARAPYILAADAQEVEVVARAELTGSNLADLPELLVDWRNRGPKLRGFAFAVDCAIADIMSQKMDLPLSSLLEGPADADVPEYLSLSSETPEVMAGNVKSKGMAHPVIQAKLGIDTIETDLARIAAVLSEMGPDQLLLADFNGALSLDHALSALSHINDPRLMWEEPCKSYQDNVGFARAQGRPVMFDQCISDLPTLTRAIADGAAAAVAIKPAFMGGLSIARSARDMCAAAGLKMRIDGPWCGQIATTAALAVAMGAPPDLLIAGTDLTEPLDTPRDLITHSSPGRVGLTPGMNRHRRINDIFDLAIQDKCNLET